MAIWEPPTQKEGRYKFDVDVRVRDCLSVAS